MFEISFLLRDLKFEIIPTERQEFLERYLEEAIHIGEQITGRQYMKRLYGEELDVDRKTREVLNYLHSHHHIILRDEDSSELEITRPDNLVRTHNRMRQRIYA